MGLSLNELNRHKEALECYETSLLIDPKDITALMNKAISLSHLGNYQDAIDYYDRAQIIDSKLKELPLAKSRLFEKLGMADESFLAAQGILNKDMEKIKNDAKENRCSIFHQFCDDEFEKSNKPSDI
jgi:tetratricopeptide (TPR) repeat protein